MPLVVLIMFFILNKVHRMPASSPAGTDPQATSADTSATTEQ